MRPSTRFFSNSNSHSHSYSGLHGSTPRRGLRFNYVDESDDEIALRKGGRFLQ